MAVDCASVLSPDGTLFSSFSYTRASSPTRARGTVRLAAGWPVRSSRFDGAHTTVRFCLVSTCVAVVVGETTTPPMLAPFGTGSTIST